MSRSGVGRKVSLSEEDDLLRSEEEVTLPLGLRLLYYLSAAVRA